MKKFNIKEFIVAEYTNNPNIPEDEEVILHLDDGKELPQELIEEVIKIVVD